MSIRRGRVVRLGRAGPILLVLALLGTACNTRTPDRWEIPSGYVGWIVAQYESSACSALPLDRGYKVLKVNDRGRICTSDKQESGEAFDKFFYVNSGGQANEIDQRTLIWGSVYSSTKRSFHFVGTETQYHASPESVQVLDQRCSVDPRC
ncbi:MAG: hypothetical protein M3003_04985 [Candidatus Dormibacteraeota bacterium]|nr:hypothetical protein [Candidatus Dormibacteraeota bacterium]